MIRSLLLFLLVGAFASTALGDLVFFNDLGDFVSFNEAQGYVLDAVEDFEENDLGPNSAAVQNEPLDGNPNVNFPTGLDVDDLSITSSSGTGVTLITDGFFGAVTSMLGADLSIATTNLTLQAGDNIAVGLDIADISLGSASNVGIFDVDGELLGSTMANSSFDSVFFGVVSDVPIGRIEIASMAFGSEVVDNIQMWFLPEPSMLAILALGFAWACAVRRRRPALPATVAATAAR